MNRLDRITSILVHLQSKRLVTAREMAERFEVSIRTIYRDVFSLRQAGVPIGEEEGKGYFIVEGYRLPPVMFSREEAAALITAEKMLALQGESSIKKHYESALMKIKALLQGAEKDRLEDLQSRIGTYSSWAPNSSNLDIIQQAISDRKVLELTYESGRKCEITQRRFHPYALYFSGAAWASIGHCQLRKALREFRLDRILKIRPTESSFEPDPSFKIDEYLKERERKIF